MGNLLALSISLFCSILIFIGPGFFTPGTYYNWADTVFPLDPLKYIQITSSAWNPVVVMGLNNLWPVFSPIAAIIYILWLIKIPLWVINRLWLVVPYTMLGYFTYFFYKSIFDDPESILGGIIAGIFAIFMPYMLGATSLVISLSAVPLLFGALLRGMRYPERMTRYAFYTGLSICLLALNPRFLFVSLLTVLLYLALYFLIQKRVEPSEIKFIALALIITFLLNLFWIMPVSFYYFHSSNFLAQSMENVPDLLISRAQLLFDYKGCSAINWIMRLLVSYPIISIYPYFLLPPVSFLTFLIPIYIYSAVFFIKEKRFILITTLTFILTLFATTIRYPLLSHAYLFLYKHLAGFEIMNNPLYWVSFLGIFYAILFGATTEALLKRIRRFRALFTAAIIIFIVFIYGEPASVGLTPAQESVWGNIAYPNHQPSMAIPAEYFQLRDYLMQHKESGYRLLNLPWNHEGYVSYKWWHNYSLPELMNFLSPLEVLGVLRFPDSNLQQDILISLNESDMDTAVNLMSDLNLKFIIVHKDYHPIPKVFYPRPQAKAYLDRFNNSPDFRKIMDNEFFTLYEVSGEVLPLIYRRTEEKRGIQVNPSMKNTSGFTNIYPLRFKENTYALITGSPSSALGGSFSILTWIFPMDTQKKQHILSRGLENSKAGYGISLEKGGLLRVYLNSGAGGSTCQCEGVIKKSWNFIGVSFDTFSGIQAPHFRAGKEYAALSINPEQAPGFNPGGRGIDYPDNQMKVYINGKLCATERMGGEIQHSDTPLLIGASGSKIPDTFFDGYIYNVQFYDKSLSEKEMQQAYHKGLGKYLSRDKMKGWWLFKNNYEGYISDLSGNGNRGHVKGEVNWDKARIYKDMLYKDANYRKENIPFRTSFPTHYKIDTSSDGPFYLGFNERFSPWWECFVNGRMVGHHSQTSEGTNEWYIEDRGALRIDIIFKVQKFVAAGTVISLFVFMGIILKLILIRLRKKICGSGA